MNHTERWGSSLCSAHGHDGDDELCQPDPHFRAYKIGFQLDPHMFSDVILIKKHTTLGRYSYPNLKCGTPRIKEKFSQVSQPIRCEDSFGKLLQKDMTWGARHVHTLTLLITASKASPVGTRGPTPTPFLAKSLKKRREREWASLDLKVTPKLNKG